jgi:Gas vesicle synthesis protein GvpL/GvpF
MPTSPRRKPSRAPRAVSARPGEMATYTYAVVGSDAAPVSRNPPAGLPDMSPLRWLPLSETIWLAAADAPLARYSAAAIEKGLKDLDWVSACAVAHERMVEHVASLGTAVPMKLFTLFASDARAIAELGRSHARLRAVFHRILGRQEWGVRVSVDEATARSRARERAEKAAAGLRAGAQFLTRKRQEHKEVRDIVDIGRTAADEVFAAIARHADQTRRHAPSAAEKGLRLLLDAAFLVPTRRADAFREAVRGQVERLAPHGYRVVLTGPWPPYNFVQTAR